MDKHAWKNGNNFIAYILSCSTSLNWITPQSGNLTGIVFADTTAVAPVATADGRDRIGPAGWS
jgi:hypothetical protein